jgi:hypothetical protein
MVRQRFAVSGARHGCQIGARRGVRGPAWGATAVTVLSLFSAGAAAPQATVEPPAAQSGVAALDTVIVEAQRQRELERQISSFVSAITLPSRTESLGRWERSVCLFVAGLPLEQGEFVLQRVSQVASEAGMPVAPQGCLPNLLVVMTPEPELFLEKWWRKNPRLFDTVRGVGAIKRTIRTDAPVRVFYNACSAAPPAKAFALRVELDCYKGIAGSKLTWGAVRAIYSVIVVVDLQQTRHLQIEPLTDYIAMLALAQIRTDPDLGTAPTILRLFDETNAARPKGLSTWDQAFLESLYGTDSSSVMQLSEIKVRMKGDLAR